MIITVFSDPIANLMFHIILYLLIAIAYREMNHHATRKKHAEHLIAVNEYWRDVYKIQKVCYQTLLAKETDTLDKSENVIWVNFNKNPIQAEKARSSSRPAG